MRQSTSRNTESMSRPWKVIEHCRSPVFAEPTGAWSQVRESVLHEAGFSIKSGCHHLAASSPCNGRHGKAVGGQQRVDVDVHFHSIVFGWCRRDGIEEFCFPIRLTSCSRVHPPTCRMGKQNTLCLTCFEPLPEGRALVAGRASWVAGTPSARDRPPWMASK